MKNSLSKLIAPFTLSVIIVYIMVMLYVQWTCVHDIQKYVPKSDDRCNDNSNDCPPARNNINPVPAQVLFK